MATIRAYWESRAMSVSWLPSSTIRPPSMTTIRSALRMVDSRWAMTSEQLAWAVHPDNSTMRTAADRYLATIRASGELQTLLERFLPFYSSSAYSPRQ